MKTQTFLLLLGAVLALAGVGVLVGAIVHERRYVTVERT